jgi:hypothetical protein
MGMIEFGRGKGEGGMRKKLKVGSNWKLEGGMRKSECGRRKKLKVRR